MPSYAKDTEVTADRSKQEIETLLERFGATAFMYGRQGNRAAVGFELRGRRYRMLLNLPDPGDPVFSRTPEKRLARSSQAARAAYEQEVRRRWRSLALLIKADLVAVEDGIVTLETVLQPFTVLPSGQTAGEWLDPQIERTYSTGAMPPMLAGLLPPPPESAEEGELR
jgi:hypothetical protein